MLSRLQFVLRCLARNQKGVTAIEYTLVAALISVAAVALLNNLGQQIQDMLDSAVASLS